MKFNKVLENIENYEAGKPIELVVREFGISPKKVIKLASNENPFGAPKAAQKTIKKLAKCGNLYPDDSYFELKNALSKRFGVSDKNIIIGAGSDQIIEFLFHAKLNANSAVLVAKTTFAMYEIYARHVGAEVIKCQSKFHNLDEFLEIYKANRDKIGIIALCVPNNPLGESLKRDEILRFLREIDDDTIVLLDAAYNEFAAFKDEKTALYPKDLISEFKNLIYAGTFSKLYGLGGMRVGYGIADTQIISQLSKIRPPFNITNLSLAAAISALKDEKFVKKSLKNNLKQMTRFEEFAQEMGINFIPSYTNFITFEFDERFNATEICDSLMKRGIILRNLRSYGLNAIRITIGKPKQNLRVLANLREILGAK